MNNNKLRLHFMFRLGQYLAERFPCLDGKPSYSLQAPRPLVWNTIELGPIGSDERVKLDQLNAMCPPSLELALSSTIKDALLEVEAWALDILRSRLTPFVVEKIAWWLEKEWSMYMPRSDLQSVDWQAYFWRCLHLVADARLEVNGRNYGLLPSLAGYWEIYPAGVQSTFDGDIQHKWRHEQIEAEVCVTKGSRHRSRFISVFNPAHFCDTLEYSFSELRHNPKKGWFWERIDAPPSFAEVAPNDEGYLGTLDGELSMVEYDPCTPYLFVNFKRPVQWNRHEDRVPILAADYELISYGPGLSSVAMQWISNAMPHFVYYSLDRKVPAVLESFRQQVRDAVDASRALPDPVWLQTGPLRATLELAWANIEQDHRNRRESNATSAKATHRSKQRYNLPLDMFRSSLNAEAPESSKVLRSLEWLEKQPDKASALSQLKVRVGEGRGIWETFVHREVLHEQEVYCASDGEGTPDSG